MGMSSSLVFSVAAVPSPIVFVFNYCNRNLKKWLDFGANITSKYLTTIFNSYILLSIDGLSISMFLCI